MLHFHRCTAQPIIPPDLAHKAMQGWVMQMLGLKENMMQPVTEERVVTYVDVLGWRHAFDTIGHDALVQVARKIANHKAVFSPMQKAKILEWDRSMATNPGMNVQGGYYEINFSFVSDSLVVSAPKANLRDLLKVTKSACMHLLGDHGFGITVGRFTHDMEHDIAIGKPLVEAVQIEENTHMPRVTLSPDACKLADVEGFRNLIYFDGEEYVLNISNNSDAWLDVCRQRIDAALTAGLDAPKYKKWKYLSEHLPKMAAAHRKA